MTDHLTAMLERSIDVHRAAVRNYIQELQTLDQAPGLDQDIRGMVKHALMTNYADSLFDIETNASYHPRLEWLAIELMQVRHNGNTVEIHAPAADTRPIVQIHITPPIEDLKPSPSDQRAERYRTAVADVLLEQFTLHQIAATQIPEPLVTIPIHTAVRLMDASYSARRMRKENQVVLDFYDPHKRNITITLTYAPFLQYWAQVCRHPLLQT